MTHLSLDPAKQLSSKQALDLVCNTSFGEEQFCDNGSSSSDSNSEVDLNDMEAGLFSTDEWMLEDNNSPLNSLMLILMMVFLLFH